MVNLLLFLMRFLQRDLWNILSYMNALSFREIAVDIFTYSLLRGTKPKSFLYSLFETKQCILKFSFCPWFIAYYPLFIYTIWNNLRRMHPPCLIFLSWLVLYFNLILLWLYSAMLSSFIQHIIGFIYFIYCDYLSKCDSQFTILHIIVLSY